MKFNQTQYNNTYKYNNVTFLIIRRNYTTSKASNLNLPTPILTFSNLTDKNEILSKCSVLFNKAGIYSFMNKVTGKQYIGSAKDLYLRLNEHLSNRKSNRALQSAVLKYGLDNFSFLYLRVLYLPK